MKEYECLAVLDNLRPILALAAEEMIAAETETSLRQRLFVVLEELFNNIAMYAYAAAVKPGIVRLWLVAEYDAIHFRLEDQGVSFNPLEYDCTSRFLNLDNLEDGEAGLFLVKTLATDLVYSREKNWNKLQGIITGDLG